MHMQRLMFISFKWACSLFRKRKGPWLLWEAREANDVKSKRADDRSSEKGDAMEMKLQQRSPRSSGCQCSSGAFVEPFPPPPPPFGSHGERDIERDGAGKEN